MVSTSVVLREARSLCKEIRKACHQLPEGPTTTDVRATSSKLSEHLLRRIAELWAQAGFGDCRGRDAKLHLLLVEKGLVPQLLTFLLWSRPLLPSELSTEPQGATYHAWYSAGQMLMALAEFGGTLAVDEPAAASALLEQLQPAHDLSKPGE